MAIQITLFVLLFQLKARLRDDVYVHIDRMYKTEWWLRLTARIVQNSAVCVLRGLKRVLSHGPE